MSARRPTTAEKILRAEREPLGAEQVEAMFDEIGLLVLEGDAAGLAAKVAALSAVRREPPAVETPPPAHEEILSPTGGSAPVPLINSPQA